MRSSFFIPLVMCLCAWSFIANAQNVKIGFVNSQKIFDDLPEAQKIKKELEGILQTWRDSLDLRSREFQREVETFQQQQGTMTDAAKQSRLQELQKLERSLREYESAKQNEAAALQSKMTNPLKEKILDAIEEIARREKLNFVFDQSQEPVMLLLYADPAYDYTNLVLDYLKRGADVKRDTGTKRSTK
ncbi:MAG: OmpH family outer membrane protein [Bacteroidota bacterium]|nr:OmpH family outer membrane protein [Bacteroidota bacterium]